MPITIDPSPCSPVDVRDADALGAIVPGHTIHLNSAAWAEINEILANPRPPTPELIAAWKDYRCYADNHPHSNW